MTPEQVERLQEQHVQDDDGLCITCGDSNEWPCPIRVLLAEWEERGSALDRAAIARGEAEAEIERLKEEARLNRAASEKHYALAEARGEQLDEAEARLAVSQKWSALWKKLAQFRGWPASKHEQKRRVLVRWIHATCAALAAAQPQPYNPADDPAVPLERISPDAAAQQKGESRG